MVTQKDIARQLGISVALVSRALSGKAAEIGASPATVQRIFEMAESMGYVPNVNARVLKGAATRTLGVVVYDFEDPFLGVLVGELQRRAREQDFSLVLSGFQRRQVAHQDLRGLLKHRIDGLIIVGSGFESKWLSPFISKHTPIACIGTGPAVAGIHSVSHDELGGLRLLVGHLAELGHRRLGFIHSASDNLRNRHDCFLKAAAEQGCEVKPHWICRSDSYVADAGCEATHRLLAASRSDLPSALLAANDLLALGALRACGEAGLAAPRDLSITGYDDIPYAHLSSPSLTTVRQPIEAMVAEAFAWATHKTEGQEQPPIPSPISPRLVVRESTAAPLGR